MIKNLINARKKEKIYKLFVEKLRIRINIKFKINLIDQNYHLNLC